MIEEHNQKIPNLNIPVSLFNYQDYSSDFLVSWYNVLSRIFKEINYSCPEKQGLNLALSVLMLPYIAFAALGLVLYKKYRANGQKGPIVKEKKTSENQKIKLAYNILTLVVICINIVVLLALFIPATLALITFCALNRKLSSYLIATLKISRGDQYENQNITISFQDKEVDDSKIEFDIQIQFPIQLKQLIRDLYKNNDWMKITSDIKGNVVLKLSANVILKNDLMPLQSQIKRVLKTSLQEFATTVDKIIKLEKKDITSSKLKGLLNEFRLKVVDSIDSKLISSLIEDIYRVAFIQAIKVGQERRKEDFVLKDQLEDILIKQELKDQGKTLPTEKEYIIKELNKLKGLEINANDISNDMYSLLKLEYKLYIEAGKLTKKTNIDIYREYCSNKEVDDAKSKAEEKIRKLKEVGKQRYKNIESKLKEIQKNLKEGNIRDSDLRQQLANLFQSNVNQDIRKKLIKRKVKKVYSNNPNKEKEVLNQLDQLDKEKRDEVYNEIDHELNTAQSEVTKCKIQDLCKQQKGELKCLELLLKEDIEFSDPEMFEKIIKEHFSKKNNQSLEVLESEIEKKCRDLKDQQDKIKINHELAHKFIDESLKILNSKLNQLSESARNGSTYTKTKECIEKFNTIKEEINCDTKKAKIEKKAEIEKKIEIIKKDVDELVKFYEEGGCEINVNDQSVRMELIDANGDMLPSINNLIGEYCQFVDYEVEIGNRKKERLIEMHLKDGEAIIKLLKQFKLEQEELIVNEEAENNYKARLLSNEKIKFSIIEDKLINMLKQDNFDDGEIKKLLQEAELEYYLAQKSIKNPIIATKDNVKYFCHDLLSPLINELVRYLISNLQNDKDDGIVKKYNKYLRVATNWVKLGLSSWIIGLGASSCYENTNKAVELTQKTHVEVEQVLQYFDATYADIGELIGNTFSDEGETFNNIVWPKIRDNFCEIWNRFFENIEVAPSTRVVCANVETNMDSLMTLQ